MTRRHLLAAFALALCSAGLFPGVALASEKAKPLEVTYYYLPG
jgi:hypothetical protein